MALKPLTIDPSKPMPLRQSFIRTAAPTLLLACQSLPDPAARTPALIIEGAPVAGMAETVIDLPVGAPLGGYTGRCDCFGDEGEVDNRDSEYSLEFNPSAGIHSLPMVQVLWLENGDQDLVLFKTDSIYSFDDLVEELEERLEDATGRELDGRVVLATSHTHNPPANYHHGVTGYLGGDRYNEEIFQRFAGSLETAALEAYETRVPAASARHRDRLGSDDHVYRDRRPENDEMAFFDDPRGSL